MKKFVFFTGIALTFFGAQLRAADEFSLDLSKQKWLFKKGDSISAAWSAPELGEGDWSPIEVPVRWEAKNPGYDGFGWYRVHVEVPESAKGEPMKLLLGMIDDADETFFNGVSVGKMGKMHPVAETAFDKNRVYDVPAKVVRYGKDNVIAIRVQDTTGDGGIYFGDIMLMTKDAYKTYLKKVVMAPVTRGELSAWKKTLKAQPTVWRTQKLANGGWTILKDSEPVYMTAVEYEPLGFYDKVDFEKIGRDFELIHDAGFNAVCVWVVKFYNPAVRFSIEDMKRMADLAKEKGLYVQYYLWMDRVSNPLVRYPTAVESNGRANTWQRDFWHEPYREYSHDYIQRLAMALRDCDNVPILWLWEEKIFNELHWDKGRAFVVSFFNGEEGRKAFKAWLMKRHKSLDGLNADWGTEYKSLDLAVAQTIRDYDGGVDLKDRRQYDVLRFAQVSLMDASEMWSKAYREIDSNKLIGIRNWDSTNPQRAADNGYKFLDLFGLNQYSYRGYNVDLEHYMMRTKVIAGVTGLPVYEGNYGFFTTNWRHPMEDGKTPDENRKAVQGADILAYISSIPEMVGMNYFMLYDKKDEATWGIVDNQGRPKPIYHSLKAVNSIIHKRDSAFATMDYSAPARVNLFFGSDAFYRLSTTESEMPQLMMANDLLDMNVNWGVVTDETELDPANIPVIFAQHQAYNRLDTVVWNRLLEYCRNGGTLVIGDTPNWMDRYGRTRIERGVGFEELNELRGINAKGYLGFGKVAVNIEPNPQYDGPLIIADVNASWIAEAKADSLLPTAKVLATITKDGKTLPGIVKNKYGKGVCYSFLFDPYTWEGGGTGTRRKCAPFTYLILRDMGIQADTDLGNRGFPLATGQLNIFNKVKRYSDVFGKYKDTYGVNDPVHNGGLVTKDFLLFRGKEFKGEGWDFTSSVFTSVYATREGQDLWVTSIDPSTITFRLDDRSHVVETREDEIAQIQVPLQ